MRNRKIIIGSVIAVALVVGWYLFRPELLFVTKTVHEDLPGVAGAGNGQQLASLNSLSKGSFYGLAHETKGIATIYGDGNGRQILRLTDFETSNGPDVHVYLVAANDARDNDTVTRSGFIDLGSLKGTQGDQNYEIPAGTDLGRYRAVSIWCRRFGVNFGTAPLA